MSDSNENHSFAFHFQDFYILIIPSAELTMATKSTYRDLSLETRKGSLAKKAYNKGQGKE